MPNDEKGQPGRDVERERGDDAIEDEAKIAEDRGETGRSPGHRD